MKKLLLLTLSAILMLSGCGQPEMTFELDPDPFLPERQGGDVVGSFSFYDSWDTDFEDEELVLSMASIYHESGNLIRITDGMDNDRIIFEGGIFEWRDYILSCEAND